MIEDIKKACEVLESGGLILYPTDTVWGIGCDATNEEAVKKVYELKKRSDSKSMIILIDNTVKLDYYVEEVTDLAIDLIEVSDKPLTIIYDKARHVAKSLLAEDGSLGIRVTEEKFSKELCRRFRKAIVSTSANLAGEEAPKCFDEISDEVKDAVDYIVSYRQNDLEKSSPSSIIKLGASGLIKVIRE